MILTKKRYLFQGSAVAIGARASGLTNEQEAQLCFESSAALPPSGGWTSARIGERSVEVPGFSISFRNAFASIRGTLLPDSVRSESTASVEDVRVQNRIHIARAQSTLIAEDPRNHGETRYKAPQMPSVDGVIVAGAELEVVMDDVFLSIPTKQALIDEYAHDEAFRECHKDRFFRSGKDHPTLFHHSIPEIGGYIVTSVVRSLRFRKQAPEGAVIRGNEVFLPGLGSLYFGELVIGAHQRVLTMVRMELQGQRVRSGPEDALSFDAADGDSKDSSSDCSINDPGPVRPRP